MAKNDSIATQFDDRPELSHRRNHFLKLGLFCVAVALAVVVTVILLTPPSEEEKPLTEEGPVQAEAVSATATVVLAAQPAKTTNEQLQAELLNEVESLLQHYAQSPQALHVAASAYDKIHQTTRAGELWEKCITLAPRHTGPRLGLAALLSEKGEDAQAVALLEKALEEGVTSAELYYRLATAHAKVGEVERAEEVMQAGVVAFPGVAINWLLLGQIQNQLQQFEDAEKSLLKSIELGSDTSEVYFALANACQRQGKVEQASDYRQRFSQLKAEETKANEDKPFQEIYQQALRPIAVSSLTSAAAIYAAQGAGDKAEQLLVRANALEPGNLEVLREWASFLRNQERIADARIVQQRLVELQPGNGVYHVNLASLVAQLGDLDAAETELEEARKLLPQSGLPFLGLAQVQMQRGHFEQARQHAEAAVAREPTAQSLALLSAICERLGDPEAARAARQAALRMAPVDP